MLSDLNNWLRERLEREFEIYMLMILFGAWYLLNIDGAMKADETIWAWQGYFFYKGNMPAEQFRPMGRYFFGLGQIFFGRTTFGAKVFILIFSVLTLYLTYKSTNILSNRFYGFIAAAVLGLIPFYGDVMVSARLDGILTFFGMLLLYTTLKWHKTEDIVKRQRLLFIMGILSVCTFATKLYGLFFSLVVFIFLLKVEWRVVKSIKIYKRKNMMVHFKKNIFLLPIFIVLGILFGLLMRAQLSDYWNQAGERGKSDVLGLLPEFLDNIILNMESTSAYMFFIVIGIILFLIFWAICALVGRYGLRVFKNLKNKTALDERYHLLIYLSGGILGFLIIYSPYIINPVAFITNSILVQSINLGDSAPVTIGGVVYDRAPFWSYAYWTYFYLGWAFVAALLISIGYTVFRYIRKESIDPGKSLVFFYTFVTFLLLSALSQRAAVYFIILFPLFTIFAIISLADLIQWLFSKTSQETVKNNTKWITTIVVVLVILVPGPLLWTIDDPQLGYDSQYDIAGDMVTEFVNSNPSKTTYIIAYDRFALRYYLSDEILDNTEIIPLFSDNYSVDALGHPNVYYPESILYNMTLAGTIDLLVDEIRFEDDTENPIRTYFRNHGTRIPIEDELVIYQL